MDEEPPQERRTGGVTLEDVAREAGVHTSTASRALDPAKSERVKRSTRDHVIDVAHRLGYRPDMVARGLKSGRTGTVGVIVADLGNSFVTPMIHGIAEAIEGSEMLSIVAESQDDHERFAGIIEHMLSRRVDGLVVQAARTGDLAILEAANRVVPVVLVSRPLDSSLCQVLQDNEGGGRLVAEHLLTLGHRTVAQLEGPPDVLNFPLRSRGFRTAAEAAGIEEIRVSGTAERPSVDDGRRLMELLLEASPSTPTAVFAHNDLMALGALTVARARGLRVPEDISLVGYNDIPLISHISPPLTTVRVDTFELGRIAARRVLDALGGNDCIDAMLEPTLVARGSSRRVGSD